MPIEIKELHIRVAVNTPSSGQSPAGQTVVTRQNNMAGASDEDKDAMVAECVEQVLQILQSKMER